MKLFCVHRLIPKKPHFVEDSYLLWRQYLGLSKQADNLARGPEVRLRQFWLALKQHPSASGFDLAPSFKNGGTRIQLRKFYRS